MSGHSKWAQIKRQKGAADKKKGQLFSKLARAITLAAKEGGDPDSNYKLRLEMDRAKDAGMPQESIQRAARRGTGEDRLAQIEEITYEGFGPQGAALMIQGATDNRNRTTSNIRRIFTKHQGNLGNPGSVDYLFTAKGQILVPQDGNQNLEEISLLAIDLGAEDVKQSDEGLEIYTAPLDLGKIKKALEAAGIQVTSYEISMEALTPIQLENDKAREQLVKLIEELEEDDDVIAIHTNANL